MHPINQSQTYNNQKSKSQQNNYKFIVYTVNGIKYFLYWNKKKIERQILSLQSQLKKQHFALIQHYNHSNFLDMNEKIIEPVTHSILRNSQARRQSSLVDSNYRPCHENIDQQTRGQQKYHFRYSKPSQPQGFNRLSNSHVQNCETQYVIQRRSHVAPQSRQSIIVCQSLPKTRPKYAFTYLQTAQNTQLNIKTPRASLNIQQQAKHPSSQQKPQPRNIRSDIDVCLYTITDTLKEIQQSKQCQQTRKFVDSKLGQPGLTSEYKPSISQLRKNKKNFLDRSIHRIHPQIVNQYIDTVYRDYDIPNPMLNQSQRENQGENRHMLSIQSNLAVGKVEKEKVEKKQEKAQNTKTQLQGRQLNQRIEKQQNQRLDKQKNIIIYKQPDVRVRFQVKQQILPLKQQQQRAPSQFRQDYSLHNTKSNRRNNLISQKQKENKIGKKKFLDLTLSREKEMKVRKFQSPENQKVINIQQQKQSERSSRSKSKNSASQKRILDIKKNISSWRDSQHQYVEHYSYLESPFETIHHRTAQHEITTNKQPLISDRPVNIVVRPFQEMMKVTAPTQYHDHPSQGINTNTQYVSSQLQQSKYVQSFFTVQGEVMEEFRYCVLCEQTVLSANIFKHEEKCIGWIDDQGRLVTFRQLYQMDKQEEVKQLIREKILEIQRRISNMIQKLKNTQSSLSQKAQPLHHKILQTAQSFLQSYTKIEFDSMNIPNRQLFSSTFKKLQQINNDSYLLLLEQSRKLHWFVKMLGNYQHRDKNKSVYKSQQLQKQKRFTSTKARHNLSLTFVEEEPINLSVSEFAAQKERTY